jgi:hypothetical protein
MQAKSQLEQSRFCLLAGPKHKDDLTFGSSFSSFFYMVKNPNFSMQDKLQLEQSGYVSLLVQNAKTT